MSDAPTTPILDDFDRANESPLSGGGNWLATHSNRAGYNLTSNQAVAGAQQAGSYWAPSANFADCEVYADFGTGGLNSQCLFARAKDVGGSDTFDGYRFWANSNFFFIEMVVNLTDVGATSTTLFRDTPPIALTNGDSMMLRCIGPFLTGWVFRVADGFWRCVASVTNTVLTNGYFGMIAGSGAGVPFASFGGGRIVDPSHPPPFPPTVIGRA